MLMAEDTYSVLQTLYEAFAGKPGDAAKKSAKWDDIKGTVEAFIKYNPLANHELNADQPWYEFYTGPFPWYDTKIQLLDKKFVSGDERKPKEPEHQSPPRPQDLLQR